MNKLEWGIINKDTTWATYKRSGELITWRWSMSSRLVDGRRGSKEEVGSMSAIHVNAAHRSAIGDLSADDHALLFGMQKWGR